jgi:hypothetical protein
MFKKNAWIAGLIAVLAIMFVGCVDPYEPPPSEGEWGVVADFQELIKDVDPQVLTPAKWNEIFDGTPFRMCGESSGTFEIISVGGKKALRIHTISDNWGVGFDARHFSDAASNVVGVDFKVGDKIFFKGKADTAPDGYGVVLNTKGQAGLEKVGNWACAAGDFDVELELTVADVAAMVGNSYKNSLRIHREGSQDANRQIAFQVEEFRVEGFRKTGEGGVVEPPEDPYFPGKGSYEVPADTSTYNTSFYVDLNEAQKSALSGKPEGAVSKIEKGKATIGFTAAPQVVYIPFTDDQAAFVKSAAERGFTVNITINGSYTDNSPNTSTTIYRWALTNGEGSSWATFNLVDHNTTFFNTSFALSNFGNQNRDPKGFLFQAAGGAGGATQSGFTSSTLVINSILISVTGSASAATEITSLKFTIAWGYVNANAPYQGLTAPTAVTATGTGYDGALTWSPALPASGKFAPLTQYTANIVVTPKVGYYFGVIPSESFGLEGDPDDGYDLVVTTNVTVNTNKAVFDPASKTVTYTFPGITGASLDPINRPEYNGTKLTVRTIYPGLDTTTDADEVTATNGDIAYKAGNNGFIFRSLGAGGGYQEEYPKFKITLTNDVVENGRIKFSYKGIDGDIGWKDVGIAICTEEPTGDVNINSDKVLNEEGDDISVWIWKENYANNGQSEMVFTATLADGLEAGEYWIVITMHGGKRKSFEVYDISFLPTPPTFVNVKVGAATQEVVPVAVKGSVEMLDGSVGFIQRRASDGGYQGGYAYFPVDLGEGKSITDYTSVKVTIFGSGTDCRYKGAGVVVKKGGTALSGDIKDNAGNALSNLLQNNGYPEAGETVTRTWSIASANTNGGGCVIDDDVGDEQNVFISIYVHAPATAVYTITSIELIE